MQYQPNLFLATILLAASSGSDSPIVLTALTRKRYSLRWVNLATSWLNIMLMPASDQVPRDKSIFSIT